MVPSAVPRLQHNIDMFSLVRKFDSYSTRRCIGLAILLLVAVVINAKALEAEESKLELLDIRSIDPSIVVELRYAGRNNLTGHALYPPGTRALVRPEVAQRLAIAQRFLRRRAHGLKIWDAYRPRSVQVQLWRAAPANDYVADPQTANGSLHTWGVAVDATLVDSRNQPVMMPTDFDDFTPAAMLIYCGANRYIRSNLALLQAAMGAAGFYGQRREWWHFIAPDWKSHVPDPDLKVSVSGKSPKSKS
ncbi:MAG TPA: M15 family metallopeptidase [Candidatus Udaeobacter sp.]|nr:M15 family metallopeptidase [Candidatus Udaeobacter sp.]